GDILRSATYLRHKNFRRSPNLTESNGTLNAAYLLVKSCLAVSDGTLLNVELLADAELGEDEAEHVLGGGRSGQRVQPAERLVKIQQHHFVRNLRSHCGAGRIQPTERRGNRLMLAQI